MASGYVVDTCVFVRWFIEQIGFEHAREVRAAFLAGDVELETLDGVRFELGYVLHKQGFKKGRLDRKEYSAATRLIDDLGVGVHVTNAEDLEEAAELNCRYDLGFFDAMLVHRALKRDTPLLTSDRKLADKVSTIVPIEILRGVP